MSFDPFHACLYNDKMTELKEAVVIEGYGDGPTPNSPGIIQNAVADHPGVTAGVILALAAIVGVGGLVDAHNFQQDVKHDRRLKQELLIHASTYLGMTIPQLEKLVTEEVKKHPELYTAAAMLPDVEDSSVDKFVKWWTSPSSREIKHNMQIKFIPALKEVIKQQKGLSYDMNDQLNKTDDNAGGFRRQFD